MVRKWCNSDMKAKEVLTYPILVCNLIVASRAGPFFLWALGASEGPFVEEVMWRKPTRLIIIQ